MNALREFCRGILESPGLEAKLRSPEAQCYASLQQDGSEGASEPSTPLLIDQPARGPGLTMSTGAGRLPRPRELADATARAKCLARFAHHELMAVELFAWALLRWPDIPIALQRGLLRALEDEQIHCRLYLDRLSAQGAELNDFSHSDYFWKHVPAIAQSPHGARAFLCAMGLTFEQANLDFTLLYRDAFRRVEDEDSALVCQRVHDDEIDHVRLASQWNRRLEVGIDRGTEKDAYAEAVPFPLSAARAKGKQFSTTARRRAGLSDDFIDYIRTARSSAETAGAKAAPTP